MTDTGASWVSRGNCTRGAAGDGIPTLLTNTTTTDLLPAPGTGNKWMIDDVLIGVDAACYLSLVEETSGNLLCPRIYFPGAGFYQITPRDGLLVQTANKKARGTLSTTANCSVLLIAHPVTGGAS